MGKLNSITLRKDNSMIEHYIRDDGVQDIYRFKNGYGASVVCSRGSYGGKQGLKELAVLDKDGSLCYDTPVTSDVIGWLTDEQVEVYLSQIASLPAEMKKLSTEVKRLT